ncbi:MAG: amidohydrolase family protein [Polyangiaceae bacterium]|nr:amidohydrolase family protein [Polyangiaceae bacterium]
MMRTRSLSPFSLPLMLGLAACAAETSPPEGGSPNEQSASLTGASLVVNECATGTAGYIELYNPATSAIDLTNDPSSCWFVDDINGGGAPKRITDSLVNHAASSTTCSSAGRPATCGLIGPGEHVWVPYAYVNATTADACRLISSAKSSAICGTTYTDTLSGGSTASASAGQCFGRAPSGGAWLASAITCSQGTSNGGGACTPGSACNDGNLCTTGETYSATCVCGGGTSGSCDDANPCTADSCDAAAGCGHTNVADGTVCGAAMSCSAGACVPDVPPPSGDAQIVQQGALDKVLLRGTVVTASSYFAGEVLVEGDTITCAAASCAGNPGAVNATIVATNGIIMPGLIDTHNHILFDIFDESDWSPTKSYTNHDQWPNDARYGAMVDAKQYLNGEYGSPVNVNCELNKYGELKGLIAGTTSIAGAANPANKACYGSLARTIDQTSNDLGYDKVQASTLFPTTASADGICSNFSTGKTDAFLIHVGEGVDATSLNEFNKLWTVPTTDGCLHSPQTSIVHGTAFGDTEFTSMAQHGMGLVWSPRSNVFLYGAGTDLTKTTNIPLALAKGINVSLAPDWSIGGSQNLLDELRFAQGVDDGAFGNVLTAKQLFEMVTINPAKNLGLSAVIGSIAVGKKADLMVIGGNSAAPYDALLQAEPKDVRMVMVGGRTLYGDSAIGALAPSGPACEPLAICGANKFVCVAETGGTASNKLGQSYADIVNVLSTELQSYDNQNLTSWKFSPIAPLVKCGTSGS